MLSTSSLNIARFKNSGTNTAPRLPGHDNGTVCNTPKSLLKSELAFISPSYIFFFFICFAKVAAEYPRSSFRRILSIAF